MTAATTARVTSLSRRPNSARLGRNIAAGFAAMKQAAASETPAIQAVFAGITLARDHDHLKFSAKLADTDGGPTWPSTPFQSS